MDHFLFCNQMDRAAIITNTYRIILLQKLGLTSKRISLQDTSEFYEPINVSKGKIKTAREELANYVVIKV